MKNGKNPKSPGGSQSLGFNPTQKIQELRNYLEQEKGKPKNVARFKEANTSELLQRPVSGTSAKSDHSQTSASTLQSVTAPKPIFDPKTTTGSQARPLSRNEITDFLSEIGLARYVGVFQEHGIDDLETALEMNESHFTELGIPLGHRIKIMKKLKLKQETQKAEVTECQKVDPKKPEKSDIIGSPPQQSDYSLYQAALLEFRKSAPSDSPQSDKKQTTPISKPPKLPKANKAQANPSLSPDTMLTVTPLSKPPKSDISVISTGLEGSMSVNERESCWECFRTFFRDVGVELEGKVFCSNRCRVRFQSIASVTCPCGVSVLRSVAVFSEGVHYCSSQCVPNTSGDRDTSATSPISSDRAIESGQAEELRTEEIPERTQPELHVIPEDSEELLNERMKEDSPGLTPTPLSVTAKIDQKYRKRGNATIKEAALEESIPPQKGKGALPLLMESTEDVRGWDAPSDASFDFGESDASK